MGAEMSGCCEPTPQGSFAKAAGKEGHTYPPGQTPVYHTQGPYSVSREGVGRTPVTNWGDKGVPVSFEAQRSQSTVDWGVNPGGTFDANGAYESRRGANTLSSQVCVCGLRVFTRMRSNATTKGSERQN